MSCWRVFIAFSTELQLNLFLPLGVCINQYYWDTINIYIYLQSTIISMKIHFKGGMYIVPAKKYGIGGNILFGKILWTCTVYTVGIIIQPLSTIHLQLNLVHWFIWCKHCPCFNSIPDKLQNRPGTCIPG